MSALRRAGVWLGLVEEDDRQGGYDDEYGDDEDFAPAARPRSIARTPARATDRAPGPIERELRLSERAAERGADRAEFSGYGHSADRDFQADSPGRDRDSYRDVRAERDRIERDRIERDRIERDRIERDRIERERLELERLERDRVERERVLRAERDLRVERDLQAERDRQAERVRAEEPRTATVRQLARPGQAPATATTFPTQDNLALAPQVQLRERAVVGDDKSRRMQITTLHPTTYNEARAIGEHFRDGFPVIMNLTEMDEPDAKRLVDFAAGLAFGLRGSMERVTNRVFLLSPANITVSAEDKARIAEGGFFDQG